jgi:hypothetical protein
MGNIVLCLTGLFCLFACPRRHLLCIWFQWAIVGLGLASAIIYRPRLVAIHPLQTESKPSLRCREALYQQIMVAPGTAAPYFVIQFHSVMVTEDQGTRNIP